MQHARPMILAWIALATAALPVQAQTDPTEAQEASAKEPEPVRGLRLREVEEEIERQKTPGGSA